MRRPPCAGTPATDKRSTNSNNMESALSSAAQCYAVSAISVAAQDLINIVIIIAVSGTTLLGRLATKRRDGRESPKNRIIKPQTMLVLSNNRAVLSASRMLFLGPLSL